MSLRRTFLFGSALALATVTPACSFGQDGGKDRADDKSELTGEADPTVHTLVACGDADELNASSVSRAQDGNLSVVGADIVITNGQDGAKVTTNTEDGFFITNNTTGISLDQLNTVGASNSVSAGEFGYFSTLEGLPESGQIEGSGDYRLSVGDEGDVNVTLFGADESASVMVDGNPIRPSVALSAEPKGDIFTADVQGRRGSRNTPALRNVVSGLTEPEFVLNADPEIGPDFVARSIDSVTRGFSCVGAASVSH